MSRMSQEIAENRKICPASLPPHVNLIVFSSPDQSCIVNSNRTGHLTLADSKAKSQHLVEDNKKPLSSVYRIISPRTTAVLPEAPDVCPAP